MRTSSYYQADTIKAFFTSALSMPLKTLTTSKTTEFYLKNISFEINRNERVALLGKNGSGKSTLCRLIAAQIFPSSGNIENSFEVSLFSQIEHSFYKELSGYENLKFFIRFMYHQLTESEQAALLAEAVEFSELGNAAHRLVETYSAGMTSRLALSLILAKKHDFLILDEIHSHADIGFRKKVADKLQRVIKNSNSAIVVSHYPDEILDICSRGIVIDGGKIIFDGNIEKAIGCYRLLNFEAHA